jgi:hypothetical protein
MDKKFLDSISPCRMILCLPAEFGYLHLAAQNPGLVRSFLLYSLRNYDFRRDGKDG